MERRERESSKKNKSTEDTHSAFISNITESVCMFMPVWFTIILCKQSGGRGLFPKNLPRVNYTQTGHPISTLQRQTSTGQCVLLKDRACDSQYNPKHWEEQSTSILHIIAYLFHFLHFIYSHLPPHTSPNSLMHSSHFIPVTWVEMDVFDLELCLVVIWNVLPGGQEHLTFWEAEGQKEFMWEDTRGKKKVESKKEECSLAVSDTEGCCLAFSQMFFYKGTPHQICF